MSNNNEKLVKDIRRRTRKKYSSEEKIRIVLEGMRGEEKLLMTGLGLLLVIWMRLLGC